MINIKFKKGCVQIMALVLIVQLHSCKEHASSPEGDSGKGTSINLSAMHAEGLKVDTAKMVANESVLNLSGKISFDESKVINLFPLVSGKVAKVFVKLGQKVEKGELLATIHSSDISTLQNNLVSANSALTVAKKNLDVAEDLYKSSYYSERDLFAARDAYKQAQSSVDIVKEQLAVLGAGEKTNSSEAIYKVISPIAGYIVQKNINESQDMRSDNGTNIFTISSLNTVWVLANVYENDIAKIKLNDRADIVTLAYSDSTFQGKVDQINSVVDPETKSLKVRIVLDNNGGLLKPEMFANVKIHSTTQEQIMCVPTSALVFSDNSFNVIVPKGKNSYTKHRVKLMRTVDMKSFVEGIDNGTPVIKNATVYLANIK
ncbi:MAG: efflux RND transporter periplasmic adaptor subunit [Bacteroidetes bacterium]|nr:efflux RND transporter periplasmic adaptor subunit [Bacteroidota bacterium]